MIKSEIVSAIAMKVGVEQRVASMCVESFMETVKDAFAGGENVYLRGFGSFICKERGAKAARNMATGETVMVSAHKVPAFKPSEEFKNIVRVV